MNICEASEVGKGLSLSITRLHNVRAKISSLSSSVISMALKHNAQLVLGDVRGRDFGVTGAWTLKGGVVQQEGLLQL